AIVELDAPFGRLAKYWPTNSSPRWTNAVAPGATRLIAPPYASNRIPPVVASAGSFCRCCRAWTIAAAPDDGIAAAKKSDFATDAWRSSTPAGFWLGRWHCGTVRLEQPASPIIAAP